jgi:hypothetical protein
MADPRPGGNGPIAESKRLREQMLTAAANLEEFSAQLLVQVERLRAEAAPLLIREAEAPDER